MQLKQASRLLADIRENVARAVVGRSEVVDLLLIALAAGGHVLIEDVPGLGKTTLVRALAKSLGCTFRRIQFTPDMLPSDVTGFTTYRLDTGEKELREGAVMTHLLLADEINRTSPKTQSSLLEAMQEGQVTIDGTTHLLPRPFLVLATQNPAGLAGTYPLPEAQLDRFLLKLSVGYPSRSEEIDILRRWRTGNPVEQLEPVAGPADILELQSACDDIACAPEILQYIVEIAERTRQSEEISLGVSPRGSLALLRASAARALLQERGYVLPDDVQALAVPVLSHRIVTDMRANVRGRTAAELIERTLDGIRTPGLS